MIAIRRILAASRFLTLFAVAGSFAAFVALLVSGAIRTVLILAHSLTAPDVSAKGLKTLSLAFIEIIDVFLLATVFYVVALGLYELFIDDEVELPAWLAIHDLEDLKVKLTSIVVVVLGVVFLGHAVKWDGGVELLHLGAAIALVVGALTYFLSQKTRKSKADERP